MAGPLLRLRSDEQLLELFRAGSEDAFAVIHDRYRQRLFAYARQMLPGRSRQDAEDVLQDVFVRAYGALRADVREVNVRAWLYRVAHNRCIDQVRRPQVSERDVLEMSRTPLVDPVEKAQRRDDLRRLVHDVGRLPEQQRSALLMREIDGMAYADIADALGVTLPAVKSLLVRARVGLAEAAEARETDCSVIREDLVASYDRGVKASARARRHMRECDGCREFKTSLRGLRRSFAAISPLGALGPLALVAKALGLGGGGTAGAVAGGGTAGVVAGGGTAGGAIAGGSVLAAATTGKVAAMVCTAAITAGAAAEVKRKAAEPAEAPAAAVRPVQERPRAVPAASASPVAPAVRERPERSRPARPREAPPRAAVTPAAPVADVAPLPIDDPAAGTGGTEAPAEMAPPVVPSGQPPSSVPRKPELATTPDGGTADAPDAPPAAVNPNTAGGTPPAQPGAPPRED